MKFPRKIKKYIVTFCLLLVAVITPFGSLTTGVKAQADLAERDALLKTQETVLIDLYTRIRGLQLSIVSGCLAHFSIEDLLADSSLIAIGKVTGKSKSYYIETADGSSCMYTDTYFTITNTLKGEPYAETVAIRQEGGSIDINTVIVNTEPKLKEGQEYLLFLYNPKHGGSFETQDDYYRIYGLPQGTFVKAEDGEFYNIETNAPLPEKVFISPHLDEEVDEDYFRKKVEEAYRNNLATGFITEEEYEQYMRELDVYATKIPRE